MTFRSGEAQALRRRIGMRTRSRRGIFKCWMGKRILNFGFSMLVSIQNMKFPIGSMDCVLLVLCFDRSYECCGGDG